MAAWAALPEVRWAVEWQGWLLARRTGRTRVRRGESLVAYVSRGNSSTEVEWRYPHRSAALNRVRPAQKLTGFSVQNAPGSSQRR